MRGGGWKRRKKIRRSGGNGVELVVNRSSNFSAYCSRDPTKNGSNLPPPFAKLGMRRNRGFSYQESLYFGWKQGKEDLGGGLSA